jgi:hypothetical protein
MIDIIDTRIPMDKIYSFVPIKIFSKYTYGTINKLNVIKNPHIPLYPNFIIGVVNNQAKIIEHIGINDHVKVPDIATSQMAQVIIPSNESIEYVKKNILFSFGLFLLDLLPFWLLFISWFIIILSMWPLAIL